MEGLNCQVAYIIFPKIASTFLEATIMARLPIKEV